MSKIEYINYTINHRILSFVIIALYYTFKIGNKQAIIFYADILQKNCNDWDF